MIMTHDDDVDTRRWNPTQFKYSNAYNMNINYNYLFQWIKYYLV